MSELTPEERIARLRAQRGQPSAPRSDPSPRRRRARYCRRPSQPRRRRRHLLHRSRRRHGADRVPIHSCVAGLGGRRVGDRFEHSKKAPRRAGAILRRKPHPARKARWAIGIAAVGGFVAMLPAMGPVERQCRRTRA